MWPVLIVVAAIGGIAALSGHKEPKDQLPLAAYASMVSDTVSQETVDSICVEPVRIKSKGLIAEALEDHLRLSGCVVSQDKSAAFVKISMNEVGEDIRMMTIRTPAMSVARGFYVNIEGVKPATPITLAMRN
jgi:hypothetical protein